MELNKITGGRWQAAFAFQQPSPAQVMLSGEMDGREIQASLHRVDPKSLPLYENGFRWIQ